AQGAIVYLRFARCPKDLCVFSRQHRFEGASARPVDRLDRLLVGWTRVTDVGDDQSSVASVGHSAPPFILAVSPTLRPPRRLPPHSRPTRHQHSFNSTARRPPSAPPPRLLQPPRGRHRGPPHGARPVRSPAERRPFGAAPNRQRPPPPLLLQR